MVKTSARLLRLLSLLQSRRHWTGADLAARLEIDARTVRRDVERLRELGYPVRASAGLGGGYQLGAGSALPPVILDDDEAVAVAVALRAAAGSVGGMEETTVGLLSKLDQILPSRLRKRATALYAVTLTLGDSGTAAPVDVLTQIAAACRDHQRVKLAYRDREGKTSERRIEPLRLAHAGRRWYLVAWDLVREDWRTFRVDRVEALLDVGPAFVPRAFPEDIAQYVARSITQPSQRFRVRLRLEGPASKVSKQIPRWCGVLEAVDDTHCLLSVGAESTHSLAAMLLLVGVDFTIVEGLEHLAELNRQALRLARATQETKPSPPAAPGERVG
ncbi:helix-turn-helix transcriptional regulator [Tahibacter soli]|uniref:YafY family protein n=1 Tax=Tahibacter soli TaxID=2983605 RepID=A0A9X4BHJ8_9GAMM|nr:YafY family protein [Tahibacter soli]MDC8012478.1 YafY family protein [Tahibacter soli]